MPKRKSAPAEEEPVIEAPRRRSQRHAQPPTDTAAPASRAKRAKKADAEDEDTGASVAKKATRKAREAEKTVKFQRAAPRLPSRSSCFARPSSNIYPRRNMEALGLVWSPKFRLWRLVEVNSHPSVSGPPRPSQRPRRPRWPSVTEARHQQTAPRKRQRLPRPMCRVDMVTAERRGITGYSRPNLNPGTRTTSTSSSRSTI